MCGIGGILRVQDPRQGLLAPERAVPEAWLDIIDESIKHRGPDGHGRFRDRAVRPDGSIVDVALVHRRLSIIDHAGGHQPMVLGRSDLRADQIGSDASSIGAARGSGGSQTQEPHSPGHAALLTTPPYQHTHDHTLSPCPCCGDNTLVVVFNGCIYNHRELRRELEAAGHTFTTDHSDTEVLLHGWREWKDKLADHLDGMYAMAIWDAQQCSLVVLRDPFGEKPLYTLNDDIRDPQNLAFASTPAALVRLQHASGLGTPGVEDMRHVAGWIQFGWAQGFTTLRGITGEIAGTAHCLTSAPAQHENNDTDSHPKRYASCKVLTFFDGFDGNPTVDTVDQALREAVHSRVEADVPIGCFLSGGIDSALVTHYAAEKVRDLTAFTVRMPSAAYDESVAATRTAACLDIRHEILDCEARPASDLVELIHELGLPFGDNSLLPSLWVNRAARRTFKVALTGDGGDELFLGYDRHRALGLLSALRRLPAPLRRTLANLALPGRSPRSIRSRASRLLAAAGYEGYKELTAIFPTPLLHSLCTHPGVPCHSGQTRFPQGSSAHKDALRFDRAFYLPDDLLRKSDTASMHVALEARAPMLARGVVEQVINASVDSLMPNGQRKGLLRQVARKYFPPEIVDRPKMGFAIPIGDWFRNDFGSMRQLLYDHLESAEPFGPDALGINGMINMDSVRRMLREHDAAGERSLWPWHGRDHSQRLYMLLVLSIWARWLDGLGRTGE